MLKTIKVINLAPGESLLILTQPAPTPAPPGAANAQPSPFLIEPQDDDKLIALVRVASGRAHYVSCQNLKC